MAKDSKAGSNAGKGKGRIPKRIGGVKVPKELRRTGEALLDQGGALLDKANTPAGREMIAAGLSMAAAAASAAITRTNAAREGERQPPAAPIPPVPPEAPVPPVPPREGQRTPEAQVIADALGQAAEQVLGRLFGKRG